MAQHAMVERISGELQQQGAAGLAEWLTGQSQEVWAYVIRGLEGQGATPEARVLEWMVGRRELDRSNAVRLFWSLFSTEVWMGTREDGRLSVALERLVERFEAGFYTVQALEVSPAEAFCFRHRLRRLLRRARIEGWDETQAMFAIPEAFVRPMPGLPVAAYPTLHPSRLLTGEARRAAEAMGAGLLAAGRELIAARQREARLGWWRLRAGQTAVAMVLAMAVAVAWVFVRQDMRQMLAMVGY